MPIDQSPSTTGNTARLFGSLAIITIGVAATLATVLGFFGSAWWAFDVLAGYRVQLTVLLLAVAGTFRIGFGAATGVLFVAAAVTNIVVVFPLFFGSNAAAAASSATLTVASVPVEEAGREEALEWVAGSGADVAFLLDTDDTWAGLTPAPDSGYVTVGQVFIGRQTGATVLARAGLDVDVEGLGNTNTPVVRAVTTLGTQPVVVYALLVPAPTSDTEARQRDQLLRRVSDRVAAETVPVAVVGDIGVSQWSHGFRVLAGDGVLDDSSPGNGFQGSTPGGLWIGLRTPTHHLLYTDALTVTERHLGPDLGHGRTILQGTLAVAAG